MVFAAVFASALVIAVGFLLVSPLFFRGLNFDDKQQLMLSFSVLEPDGCVAWCGDLSRILRAYDIGATVFFVGSVAEQYPECVSLFGDNVDIGSQAFSSSNLTAIADYNIQLEEVRRGKSAVDAAGDLYSRVFRAPNGATDQNIYSLLSRNDIFADFSYRNQYNVFIDGQFVRFDAVVFDGIAVSASSLLALEKTSQLVIVHFDDSCPVDAIAGFIGALKTGKFDFVNASEATGLNLTVRGD